MKFVINFGSIIGRKDMEKDQKAFLNALGKISEVFQVQMKYNFGIRNEDDDFSDESIVSLSLYREVKQRRTIYSLQKIYEAVLDLHRGIQGFQFEMEL